MARRAGRSPRGMLKWDTDWRGKRTRKEVKQDGGMGFVVVSLDEAEEILKTLDDKEHIVYLLDPEDLPK